MTEAEQIMKRCQAGTRNYEEANNLHAACYGIIGKLLAQTEQEPIYQYQMANGSWIDQTKESHDYNVRHGQATVRVVHTAPPQLEQEPVADDFFRMIADKNPKPFPLPQRRWVGLTDEEIDAIYTGVRAVHHEINSDLFARAIESKLKEVNT